MRIHPLGYLLLDTVKCSSADEQDVTRVHMDVILIRCLRPPLGGTLTIEPSRSFSSPCCTPSPLTSRVMEGLSLLRAILSISVDKDNTPLSSLYIIIGHLQQTGKNTLYILPYIAGLGKHRSIHYRERHMQ